MTREQVVGVALEVMARDGLDAVSFRTVGMRLGVDPKALYTYVNDKDDLLAAMFDTAMAGLDLPRPDDERPPEDRVVDMLVSFRRALTSNADLYRLVRPLHVRGIDIAMFETMADTLRALGPSLVDTLQVYLRLVRYTVGSATYAHRSELVPSAPDELGLDLDSYPNLRAFAELRPSPETEEDFAATVRAMLEDGLRRRRR